LWSAVIAVALVLGTVPAARAAPHEDDIVLTSYYLWAHPEEIEICENGRTTITVSAWRADRRFFTSSSLMETTDSPQPNIDIWAIENNDSATGSFSAHTQTADSSGEPESTGFTDVDGAPAPFSFVAGKAGETTLEFTANIGGREVTAEVDVEVIKCKYRLTAKSVWRFTNGWKPKAEALLEVEIAPDENGQFDVLAPVGNSMAWTVPTPLCGHPGNVGPTKARVKGKIQKVGLATLGIVYDETGELQKFICPYIGTAAARPDTGMPKRLTPAQISFVGSVPMPGTKNSKVVPHTLMASPIVQGTATISLEAIPQ
jgi:hypothetical protein